MCLTSVSFTKKGLGRTVYTGYKIFKRSVDYKDRRLWFQYYHNDSSRIVKIGVWLKSSEKSIEDTLDNCYTAGFHIYEDLDQAKKTVISTYECVVKVKYKGVLAKGKQVGQDVVIAKHMRVPRQRIPR